MAITTWVATTGDWDDSKFDSGWDGPAISPDAASLSLSPSWTSNTNTWAEETLDWQYGLEPSYKFGISYTPGAGSLEVIQSYEWDQMGSANWNDTTYSWNTGPSPNVNIGTGISPAKGDLTLTGYTPAQGIIYTYPVANADLTVTGKIPEAADGTIISPDKGDLEVLNSHTWNNYGGTWAAATTNWNDDSFAPDAVETAKNQPAVGELTLTPHAPRRTESIGFPIPKGDLTLTGYAPRNAGISHFRSPAKGDITGLTGTAGPWNDNTETWATITGAWQVGELTPTAGITYTFPIDEAETLTLDGYSPVKVRKDPTYFADIIVT